MAFPGRWLSFRCRRCGEVHPEFWPAFCSWGLWVFCPWCGRWGFVRRQR
ncbi:MAG: hypothetical protein JNM56_04550 [Planctomycetia bacterium]|nr:hypothetical protein [Planctomycetia bacterium]